MTAKKTIRFRRIRIKRSPFPIRKFILLVFLGLLFSYFMISIFNEVNPINVGGVTSEEQQEDGTAVIRFIIPIITAEHLNENKDFISNIYDELKESDDIWSEEIYDGEYVRAVFEEPLTSKNDITVYPRIVSGNPKIEVYEKDKNDLIAKFENLNDNQYNKVLLTKLQNSQNTFDLKIVGGSVEFDHIIDPFGVNVTSVQNYYFENAINTIKINLTGTGGLIWHNGTGLCIGGC